MLWHVLKEMETKMACVEAKIEHNGNQVLELMYQSIPSLTILPRATPGDSHILVAPGVGFSLLCLARGVLNQSKSSIILKKARFLLCLSNNWVAALFICLYMLEVSSMTWSPFTLQQIHNVSEFIQVNWNSSWSKFHRLHDKENQTIFTFLTAENLLGLPCSHEC